MQDENIKKCAEEVGEVLKKYNCTMQVQQGVTIVPLPTPTIVDTVTGEEEAI